MTPRCIIRITCLWITVAAILLVSQAYGQDVYVYSSSSIVGGQVVGTVEAVFDSSVADNYDMMLIGWLDDDQRQCKDTAGDSCSGCTYLYADLSATAVAGTAYTVTGYSELTAYYYYYPYGFYDPEYFFYFSPGDWCEEEWIRFTGPGPLVYLAAAGISLGEAFTQVQCPKPTGETSEFKGWYDTGYEEGGKFEATLSGGGNYVGRQITEEFTSATDGCYNAYPNQVTVHPPTPPAAGGKAPEGLGGGSGRPQ